MNLFNNPVIRLTLSLEAIAYALPVPIMAYIVMVFGGFDCSFYVISAFICGGIVPIVITFILRWMKLNPSLKALEKQDLIKNDQLIIIRQRLLMHPRFEALSLFIRYPSGIGITILMLALEGEVTLSRLLISFAAMLIVVPSNAIFFFFQSEIFLARYLKDEKIANEALTEKKYKISNIYIKFLYSFISVLILPLGIFIIIIVLMNYKIADIDNQFIHIILISIFSFITVIVTVYFFAKSFYNSISGILAALKKMSDGHFNSGLVPIITRDEIGLMSNHVNNLQIKIRNVILLIKTMSRKLSSSADDLFNTSEHYSNESQTTAASVEEITSTLEELSASGDLIYESVENQHKKTSRLIENIGELDIIVKTIGKEMKRAININSDLDNNIIQIKSMIGNILELMKIAINDAERMLNYTIIIDDISDKTNLLSLNASIEAARAGDYGRGFSVVADEIGSLATQTGENAKTISHMVKSTNISMEKSFTALNTAIGNIEKIFKGLESFGSIINNINELTVKDININEIVKSDAELLLERADEIKRSVGEQRTAIEEITKSITLINNAAQNTSTASENLSVSSDVFAKSAGELLREIEFFQVNESV